MEKDEYLYQILGNDTEIQNNVCILKMICIEGKVRI